MAVEVAISAVMHSSERWMEKDGDVSDTRQTLPDDLEPTLEDLAVEEAMMNGNDLVASDVIDVDSLIAERDSYMDQFARARADYQNLRRRVEQDQMTARQQAARDILLQLLPVVDDFERAMASAPDAPDQQTWVSGTRMVGKKLLGVLERYGVKRYESVGAPFDPKHHEAVATDGDGTTVVETYQDGYLLGDQVLRPAMVKTGDRPAASDQPVA
jgi:molecular chaperone GrpE